MMAFGHFPLVSSCWDSNYVLIYYVSFVSLSPGFALALLDKIYMICWLHLLHLAGLELTLLKILFLQHLSLVYSLR